MIIFENFRVQLGEDRLSINHRLLLPSDKRLILYSRRKSLASMFLSAIVGSIIYDGTIHRSARISFPLGHSAFFREEFDVKGNIAYVAETFGVNYQGLIAAACAFPGIEHLLDRPMLNLPRFAQVKLSYALGFNLNFECLIIDGTPLIGDESFRAACRDAVDRHKGGYIAAVDTPSAVSFALGECGALLTEDGVELHETVAALQKVIGKA